MIETHEAVKASHWLEKNRYWFFRSIIYQVEALSEFATTRFRISRNSSSFYRYHTSVATDVKGVPAASLLQNDC